MTIAIVPSFTCSIPDDPSDLAAGKVTPSRWNAGSAITMASGFVLGRASAGNGAVEELTTGQVKSLLSLNLVENTALSTWAGSANLATLGTVTTGTYSATLGNYSETQYAGGNTSTAQTLNLANGTFQTWTLTGNCTFTMPAAANGKAFEVLLNTGAGSFTATFTGVKWPGNTAPTITTTASRWDRLAFRSDGTNWYGSVIGQAYQ